MALIKIDNNKYVKLYQDGTYEVYESVEDRNKVKNATPSATILNKYQELIEKYGKDLDKKLKELGVDESSFQTEEEIEEFLNSHIELKSLRDNYNDVYLEYRNYDYKLSNNDKSVEYDFSIMASIYLDVKNSIPKIVESGILSLEGNTLDEVYNYAKSKKRFGETQDI